MLNLDANNQLKLEVGDLVGRSVAVLGITGSGKTNTAAVIIEELLNAGFPMTIVDIEGEYWGLKEKFEILVAGRGEHTDFEAAGPDEAAALAEFSAQQRVSVILDLSEFKKSEMETFLLAYFNRLWEVCFKVRQPYQVVLEECHEFIPQGVRTELKEVLTRIALRGRKRGLGAILMSQRSAKVEKDVLTQARLLFLHQVIHPTDMSVYKDLLPLPAREVEQMVGALLPGQAIVLFNHQPQTVQIRLRHTFHAGSTPTLDQEAAPELKKIDAALLSELKKLMAATPAPAPKAKVSSSSGTGEEDSLVAATKRIGELVSKLVESENEVARLRSQLEIVSRFKFSIEGLPAPMAVVNPKTLEVEQAIVKQLITGSSAPPSQTSTSASSASSAAITTKTQVVTSAPPATPTFVLRKALNELEEARLVKALSQIKGFNALEKRVLNILLENTGKQMSYDDLSLWTGYSRQTFQRSKLSRLLKSPFATVTNNGRDLYSSLVDYYAKQVFPGVEPDLIISRVQKALLK